MATNYLSAVSNAKLWEACRKYSPNFASSTSKLTKDIFNEAGYEQLQNTNLINEFLNISMRIGFQMLLRSKARNPLQDIVATYSTPMGGIQQRMAVGTIKPVSPAFKNLENFTSVDPFKIRKPEVSERFFGQNFDYQNFITIQDYQLKTVFLQPNGMGELVSGIMQGIENSYIIQKHNNILQVLDVAINSEQTPLQDSQIINLNIADVNNITNDELTSFILALKDLSSAMKTVSQTSAYNAGKFASVVDDSEMVLLIRSNIKNRINVNLITGAFNPDSLSLPYQVKEVNNFGGLLPYADETFETQLYPAYDAYGAVIGYNTQPDQTTATHTEEQVYWKDSNADIQAVLIQRGAIFESIQNPYSIEAIRNPRGLYTNYFASSPNNSIKYDSYFNLVVFKSTNA